MHDRMYDNRLAVPEPDDHERGLYDKFDVVRRDGSSKPGGKHARCRHFVLDLNHDPFATNALRAYATACRLEYPQLAADLYRTARQLEDRNRRRRRMEAEAAYGSDPEITRDMLLVTGYFDDALDGNELLGTVRVWTKAARAEAERWAAAVHLSASDNPVHVPPTPAHVRDLIERAARRIEERRQ